MPFIHVLSPAVNVCVLADVKGDVLTCWARSVTPCPQLSYHPDEGFVCPPNSPVHQCPSQAQARTLEHSGLSRSLARGTTELDEIIYLPTQWSSEMCKWQPALWHSDERVILRINIQLTYQYWLRVLLFPWSQEGVTDRALGQHSEDTLILYHSESSSELLPVGPRPGHRDGPALLWCSTWTFSQNVFFKRLATVTHSLSAEEKVHTFSSSCLDHLRQHVWVGEVQLYFMMTHFQWMHQHNASL